MTLTLAQALYLDERTAVTFTEILERSGLTEDELHVLVECGALEPTSPGASTFAANCVIVARRASRLREELALEDTHSLAVILRLIARIEALEQQLRDLNSDSR